MPDDMNGPVASTWSPHRNKHDKGKAGSTATATSWRRNDNAEEQNSTQHTPHATTAARATPPRIQTTTQPYRPPAALRSATLNNEASQSWMQIMAQAQAAAASSSSLSSVSSLQLYKLCDQLKHKFTYPLPSTSVSTTAVSELIFILITFVQRVYVDYSQERVLPASNDHDQQQQQYMQQEQTRLTLTVFLQYAQMLINKKQQMEQRVWDALIPLLDNIITQEQERTLTHDDLQDTDAEEDGESGTNYKEEKNWLCVDALRTLYILLSTFEHDKHTQYTSIIKERLLDRFIAGLQIRRQPTQDTSSSSTSSPPTPHTPSSPSSTSSSSNNAAQITVEEARLSILCLACLTTALPSDTLILLVTHVVTKIEQTLKQGKHNSQNAQQLPMTSLSTTALLGSLLELLHSLLASLFAGEQQTTKQTATSSPPAVLNVASILSVIHRMLGWGSPLIISNGHVNLNIGTDAQRATTQQQLRTEVKPMNNNTVGNSNSSSSSSSLAHRFSPFASQTLFNNSTTHHAQSTSSRPIAAGTTDHTDSNKLNAEAEKIRLYSLQSLQLLCTHRLSLVHQHWSPFLPTDAASASSPRPFAGCHLLTVVLYDPVPALRMLAATIIVLLLVDSPLAKWRGMIEMTHRTPHIGHQQQRSSLSLRFSEMIKGLNAGVLAALQREGFERL